MRPEVLQGNRIDSCSGNEYKWPNAAKPNSTTLRVWRQAIKRILNLQDNTLRIKDVQRCQWLQRCKVFFRWWYHEETQTVYGRDDENRYSIWKLHLMHRKTRSHFGIHRKTNKYVAQLDQHCHPVEIVSLDEDKIQIKLKGTLRLQEATPSDRSPRDLSDFWATRYVTQLDDEGESYAKTVQDNMGKIVCDGSFRNGVTSSAFVTISPVIVRGGNVVPGSRECQTSYRGELGGLLGAVRLTKQLCKKWNVRHGGVTIGCDCKGALTAICTDRRINSRWNSYDLISSIVSEIRDTAIVFRFIYIKGHQDSKKSLEELDEWELANVQADLLAKQHLDRFGSRNKGLMPERDVKDMWTICHNSELIVCNIARILYERMWALRGKHFWLQRLHLPAQLDQDIEWDILRGISTKVTHSKRQRYIKVMANLAPVGTKLYRRGVSASSHCPLCQGEEDNMHIWSCMHEEIGEIFRKGCDKVAAILFQGPDPFRKYMMTVMCNMRSNLRELEEVAVNLEPKWHRAITSQIQLGVNAGMWGFYHSLVVQLVEDFFQETRIIAKNWIAKITVKIWEIYDEMWMLRNSIKHGKGNELDSLSHAIADKEIETLFNEAPPQRLLRISECKIMAHSIDTIKTKSLKCKKKWIRDARVILNKFTDTEETAPEVQLFRTYFKNKRARYGDEVQTMDLTKDGG